MQHKITLTRFLFAAITILLSCFGLCLGQEASKDVAKPDWKIFSFTDLSGSDCRPAENPEDKGSRICKGVEGYSLLILGELKPEVYLIAPNGRRYPLRYWNTDDPGLRGLRSPASWTVINLAKKTIELSFTVEVAPKQDYSEFGSYEVVARVSPGPVCIVSSVASGPSSSAESGWLARGGGCLKLNEREKKDWFLAAMRLASRGQIRSSSLALKRVHKPAQRFIVYHEMASALFKAGKAEEARRILIGVRAEALKNPFRDDLVYTLIHVVAGLTESGFYEDAKSDIRRFSESDRLRMYIMVATIQGEKKDFEAAKRTFQEAIQIQLKGNSRAEGNLQEIGMAQAKMGFLEEARTTAALIRNSAAREVIEQTIKFESHPD